MNTENIKDCEMVLPCLAMRDLVVFPGMIMHFDVARPRSINSIKAAIKEDRKIFLVTQKDVFVEVPTKNDVYKIGVVAEIKQIIKTPDNITRILVEGLYRAKVIDFSDSNDSELRATIKQENDVIKADADTSDVIAVMRSLKEVFQQYALVMPKMPRELIASVMGENNPEALFDSVAFNVNIVPEDKQVLLQTNSTFDRLTLLVAIISKEYEVLKIEKEIHDQVTENIDKGQREYYLREQLKVIQNQLGDVDDAQSDIYKYYHDIAQLDLSQEDTDKLYTEVNRLSKMGSNSAEASVIRTYLDTVVSLPFNKMSKESIDVAKAEKILDKDHYGLKKVKERILEVLSVKALSSDVKGQIICLVGPPGVGKTSIVKSIAKAMGRKYVRVSLGGVKDESDIRGHRKTYVGAMPGRIINALKLAGTKNPVMLLDEIDKMSNDFRGDPASAMLEVLDSEQNSAFRDHYIEIPFDLSNVLFVTTANTLDTIAPPLLDRMDVIEVTSYTREEKFNIAKKHLVAKQLKKNGLRASMLKFNDDAIYEMIDSYTKEAGVRNLERTIASICRKAAKKIVSKDTKKVVVSKDNIKEFLGARKFTEDLFIKENTVGVANGLAWTSVGGVIMPLEVLILDGKGNIELTGSLGDVMKESAKIAVSYCRSVYKKYEISADFYNTKDIHIHAPEGAVPKDGPSAGVTLVTGLVSALANIPVKADVAMTGEITLHGKVLPIGGLREKTMAAYKAGIKTVIIPYDNMADLEEVDEVVKCSINFIYAKTIEDVLNVALDNKCMDNKKFNTILDVSDMNENTIRS